MKKILTIALVTVVALAYSSFAQSPVTKTFTWTAPSDNVGVVSYELRYSNDSTVVSGWTSATIIPNSIVPKAAGQGESFTTTLTLLDNTKYFAALKSKDAAGNVSLISNITFWTTNDMTGPSKVTDFQVH